MPSANVNENDANLSTVDIIDDRFQAESSAQETKTRDQLVREDLSNFGSLDSWIYNDVERGFETAHKTGKPLLVVFRCIPCEACAQLDQDIVERDLRVQRFSINMFAFALCKPTAWICNCFSSITTSRSPPSS